MSLTKRVFLPFIIILVFFFQLAVPKAARADDSQPPEVVPTEVAVDPGDGTGDPVVPTDPTEVAVDPAPAADESLTVPEILDQAPADTEIAVVNDQGDLEPLATQEAAAIIAAGDPVWCPAGEDPSTDTDPGTPGNQNSCTANAASVTELLTFLPGTATAGTIFFQDGDYTATDLTFNNTTMAGWTTSSITLQGGWDLASNVDLGGTTNFTAPIVIQWASDVTLSDLSVSNSTGYGVYVDTTGNIELTDVSASSNDYGGAVLSNYDGTGDVTVTGGEFNGNDGTGLEIISAGNVEVDGIDASGNTGISSGGLVIDNTDGTGTVAVSNSTLNNNGFDGLSVISNGTVDVTGVTADGNRFGAFVSTSGDINVRQSTFSNNTSLTETSANGLVAESYAGNITLEDVVAEGNGSGVTGTGSGFFGVGCSPYEFNGGIWLLAAGDVTVQVAASLFNSMSVNNGTGLQVDAGGNILVEDTQAIDNTGHGASLWGNGTVDVSNSTFNGNGDVGLDVWTGGDITLTDVTANGNDFAGAWLESDSGAIVVTGTGNTFADNGSYGLKIFGQTSADLTNVTATGNGTAGIYIDYLAPCGEAGGIDVTVSGVSSLIELNDEYGVLGNLGTTGSFTVSSPTIYGTGNGNDPLDPHAGDVSLVQTIHECPPPDEDDDKDPPDEEKKPFNEVEVPDDGSLPVVQDCEIYAGLIMTLPNGDDSQVACPAEGTFTVQHVAEEDLPGALPPGPEFLSALTISGVDADGNPILVLPDGASLVVSFDIPAGMENGHFTILYWDEAANDGAGKWVELPPDQLGAGTTRLHPATPEDNMLILRGVREDEGKVTVKVNFTGTFVLIAK